ncbi:MAG: hypothetical protein ACOC33_03615 [bacterium]
MSKEKKEEIQEAVDTLEQTENTEEKDVELTEEQKKELYIQQLKESRIRFKNEPVHMGNVTVNKFGRNFKKKRNNKNKLTKKSRKANRR